MTKKKYKRRVYTLWSYDIWGNARDGFEVNDRYKHGTVTIRCKLTIFNAGTPYEFVSYDPTDHQLSKAAGVRGVEWDRASDETFYATSRTNGRPVCELVYEHDES